MSVLINNNGKLDPVAGNGIQNTFTGTMEEVTAAVQAGVIKNGMVVYITDDNGVGVNAEDVTYDNTDSGLTATNVQSAIDEVDNAVDGIRSALTVETLQGLSEFKLTGGTRYFKKIGNVIKCCMNGYSPTALLHGTKLVQLPSTYDYGEISYFGSCSIADVMPSFNYNDGGIYLVSTNVNTAVGTTLVNANTWLSVCIDIFIE